MADAVQQNVTQQPVATNTQQPVLTDTQQNPVVAADEEPHLSKVARLRLAEQHWVWKFGIRAFICVINIVAIGCAGWVVSTGRYSSYSYYIFYDYLGGLIGGLVALSVSTIFCVCVMGIPFLLKPPRPTHPGIAVAFDLLIWLAMIVAGLFTVVAVIDTSEFGNDPTYLSGYNYNYGSGYNGHYYLAPNNTWIYTLSSSYSDDLYYNRTTGEYENINTVDLSARDCTPEFSTCAEQDAWINRYWRGKTTRVATTVITDAVLWLDALLHFALFVWACVDTHRYNRSKGNKREQIVADRIIADLEKRGLITVQNGMVMQNPAPPPQAHTAAAGYYGSEVAPPNAVRPAAE